MLKYASRVGLQLSEVAALKSDELKVRANRDDYFITGFLREKLPTVKLRFLINSFSE